MNRILGALCALAVVVAPTAGLSQTRSPVTTTDFEVTCRVGDAIPAAERRAFENQALRMYRLMIAGQSREAYDMMEQSIQAKVAFNDFRQAIDSVAGLRPYEEPKVVGTYLAEVKGTPAETSTACEGRDGAPEAYVAIEPEGRHAHVRLETAAGGVRYAFTYWLKPVKGQWVVYGFDYRNITVAGLEAQALFDLARQWDKAEVQFNAWMLYRRAMALASRGPYLSTPLQMEINDAGVAFDPTVFVEGTFPIYWDWDDVVYSVDDAFAERGEDGRLWVHLTRYPTVWEARRVETENRRFIETFLKVHPDVPRVFGGVQILSTHPDGKTTIATQWTKATGYEKPKGTRA